MSRFHYWSKVGSTIWLTILAGYLNAFTTVSLLHERASHMSGRTNDLGRGFMALFVYPEGIERTQLFEEAVTIAIIMASFVAGAIVATRLFRTIEFGKILLIVGALVGVSSIMVLIGLPSGEPDAFSLARALWAVIMCFPMGMQNAITSLTTLGRTTHTTGVLTDLGISIANKTHRTTIHLSCACAGFAAGGAVGVFVFFYVPSLFNQLLILTIVFMITGGFYAHPAVRRKLGTVLQSKEH